MPRRVMAPLAVVAACVMLLTALLGAVSVSANHADDGAHAVTNMYFQRTWDRTDKPVQDGAVSRTWMWGPAFTPEMMEEYADAPGGMRMIQYFDKSRMEINCPVENAACADRDTDSPWYVTNGLLVVEMVEGHYQVGDEEFDTSPAPAEQNVTGDPAGEEGLGPTYADISRYGLRDEPATAPGTALNWWIDGEGNITQGSQPAGENVTAAHRVTVPTIDHTVASVFWTFMNSVGPVWEDGALVTENLFEDPFYATGYPITEAYWSEVMVNGSERAVLWQCFERRCLTYTPGNDPTWQVEAGNVGQHYYRWRYGEGFAETLFMAHLTGSQEVPPVTTDGEGWAFFQLDEAPEAELQLAQNGDGDAGWVVKFWINVDTLEDVTASHIHTGVMGATGPVLIPLFANAEPTSVDIVEGELTHEDLPDDWHFEDLVELFLDGGAYVNVHTATVPSGEIRGQVMVADNVELDAHLSGAEGVPPVTTDATGETLFTYDNATDSFDCLMELADIDNVTAAHIHWAPVGATGDVVAPLYSTTGPVTPTEAIDCDVLESELQGPLAGATIEDLFWGMLTGETYVNVHTTEVPSGEIRGQIHLAMGEDEVSYVAELGGLNHADDADGVTGTVELVSHGGGMWSATVALSGLEPGELHPMHIHSKGDDGVATCPTAALDTNGDGYVDLNEGVPAYGPPVVDFGQLVDAAELTADDSGTIGFTTMFTVSDPEALGDTLSDDVIVVHGGIVEDELGVESYDQFLPVGCGLVVDVNPAATYHAHLTGDQVEPPVETDATGLFVVRVHDADTLSWQIHLADIEIATEAQIVWDAAGTPTVLTIWFTEGMPFSGTGILWSGLLTEDLLPDDLTPAELAAILASGDAWLVINTSGEETAHIAGPVMPWEGEM